MTNMSRKTRKKWLTLPAGYKKEAVVFFTDFHELLRRNDERNENEKKHIPEYLILSLVKRFSLPLYDEFDKIEYILDEGVNQ